MRDVVGRLGALVLAVMMPAAPALAQPQTGLIGVIEGRLGLRQPGQQRFATARPDEAIVVGQSLSTDSRSRAEIRLDAGALEVGPDTRVAIVNPNEFALPQGRIVLRLPRLDPGRMVAVDLPQGGLWIDKPGEYDVDAGTPGQPSRIAVLSGLARFAGHDADTDIKSDEAAVLTGVNPVIMRFERAAPDAFVAWARARDATPPQAAPLAGSAEPPPAARPTIAPVAPAARSPAEEPPRLHAEARPPPRHRRHERHFVRLRRGHHHAYAAYRAPFNPLQPVFNLFRW